MRRVLIGELGAIVNLGLHDLIGSDSECQIVAESTAPGAVLDELEATNPDVVLLDLDDMHTSRELARTITDYHAGNDGFLTMPARAGRPGAAKPMAAFPQARPDAGRTGFGYAGFLSQIRFRSHQADALCGSGRFSPDRGRDKRSGSLAR